MQEFFCSEGEGVCREELCMLNYVLVKMTKKKCQTDSKKMKTISVVGNQQHLGLGQGD